MANCFLAYMKRQMWDKSHRILSHVATGAGNNAITLQESRPHSLSFHSTGLFKFSSKPRSYPARTMLAPSIIREKNDAMCVSASYM